MSTRLTKPIMGVTLLLLVVLAVGGDCAREGLNDPPSGAAAARDGIERVQRTVPVVLTPAARRRFEARVVVQGSIEAKSVATVSTRLPGTVEKILVDEGDAVTAGETKLFESDSVKVREAVEISRQGLAVTRCGLREKQANLERVQADFEKAELDLHRFERLHKDEAVSIDALEQQQSRYKQTSAVVKHARTLVDLGEEQVRQAEAALVIAEKNLDDAVVYAPITGVVNMRFCEPGEMRGVGDPVVRIEDLSIVEASAFLPDHYYPQVRVGETRARIAAYGIDAGAHVVTYKAPTIQPKLRTFEVKCEFQNPPDGVVPGAMAEITVLLEQREGLGVPKEAVLHRAGRPVVFVVENDRASMVAVETGLESDGWVELTGAGVSEGARVVTMGQYLLDDGDPVSVQEDGA